MSVPLVMAATAAGMGAPAYAAGKEHQASAKAGARRVLPRILRVGDTGPDVVKLQRQLGVAADGIFGRHTLHAVKLFQRSHGLLVDGQVGPHTRAALAAARPGTDGGSEIVIRLHDRGPAVAALQRALGVTADGDFGPVTLHAVKAFQARHGLLVDGQVGAHTRAALHLAGQQPTSPSSPSGGGTQQRQHQTHHHRHPIITEPARGSLGARAVALAKRSSARRTCGAARAPPASTARAWSSTSTGGWASQCRAWPPTSTGPAATSSRGASPRRPGLLRPPRPRRHLHRRRPLHPRAAHRHRRPDLVALGLVLRDVRRRHPRQLIWRIS